MEAYRSRFPPFLAVFLGLLAVSLILTNEPRGSHLRWGFASKEKEVEEFNIMEFFRKKPYERRSIIFSAISDSLGFEDSKPKVPAPAPAPTPPVAPVIVTPDDTKKTSRCMNSGPPKTPINLQPLTRAASIIGMSSILYKVSERMLTSKAYKERVVPWVSTHFKLISEKLSHLSANSPANTRPKSRRAPISSAPLMPTVKLSPDEMEGNPLPGAGEAVVFHVGDSATTMTTLEDLLGEKRAALFAINSVTAPEDIAHLRRILDVSGQLQEFGIDTIVCIVKASTAEIQELKERERIDDTKITMLGDPRGKIEMSCGIALGASHGCIHLDYSTVVQTIYLPEPKSGETALDSLVGKLRRMDIDSDYEPAADSV